MVSCFGSRKLTKLQEPLHPKSRIKFHFRRVEELQQGFHQRSFILNATMQTFDEKACQLSKESWNQKLEYLPNNTTLALSKDEGKCRGCTRYYKLLLLFSLANIAERRVRPYVCVLCKKVSKAYTIISFVNLPC